MFAIVDELLERNYRKREFLILNYNAIFIGFMRDDMKLYTGAMQLKLCKVNLDVRTFCKGMSEGTIFICIKERSRRVDLN